MPDIKVFRKTRPLEFLYFFLMMIELGYLTPNTRVMDGGLSNPIGFAIPFIFTIIISIKNRVSFDKSFLNVVLPVALWCLCQAIFGRHVGLPYLGAYLVRIYIVYVAYVHVKVFGHAIFSLFEYFMVLLCKIAMLLWILSILLPDIAASFFRSFPSTGIGNHLFFVYNWIDVSRLGVGSYYGIPRNSGFCWEPGFFSVLICLAILFNLFRKQGLHFRNNSNIIWLLVALLSTMSASGYVIGFVVIVLMTIKKLSIKYVFILLFLFVPLGYFVSQLDFIGAKIETRMDLSSQVEKYELSVSYYEINPEEGFAMERLPSLYYMAINFIHDPIIGYGVNAYDCYFYQSNPHSIGFTGGLMKIFASYGIFLSLFFFYFLVRSSPYIASHFHSNKRWVYLIYCILEMFSYPMFGFPILTGLWFISYFSSQNKNHSLHT